ncbi:MAG: hypothetical protein BGO78_17115 [Chloroflexi bacterium 44-23]|nr:MAG: hypothetical protein BGO78_17115 [Chloroflexi bacterium 44-23]
MEVNGVRTSYRYGASILIALVFFSNVKAGIAFLFQPHKYAWAYELNGMPGEIAIAGTGLLFLMWNVPYLFALLNPVRFKISLLQALLMQLIGLVGETLLLTQIRVDAHTVLHNSIMRFIVFDAAGLLCLLAALFLVSSPSGKVK